MLSKFYLHTATYLRSPFFILGNLNELFYNHIDDPSLNLVDVLHVIQNTKDEFEQIQDQFFEDVSSESSFIDWNIWVDERFSNQ